MSAANRAPVAGASAEVRSYNSTPTVSAMEATPANDECTRAICARERLRWRRGIGHIKGTPGFPLFTIGCWLGGRRSTQAIVPIDSVPGPVGAPGRARRWHKAAPATSATVRPCGPARRSARRVPDPRRRGRRHRARALGIPSRPVVTLASITILAATFLVLLVFTALVPAPGRRAAF